MRLIKVTTPETNTDAVIKLAFSAGIERVTKLKIEQFRADGKTEIKNALDIETSTPKAKRFVDALLSADFYNTKNFSINTRQPRSIISQESLRELTEPLVEPATDILEELWQFSHLTVGFVGRVFIAAGLLALGLIHQQTLIIIAGLLFLPLLPLLLAVGFGAWTKQAKLAVQGVAAFITATVLLVLGGALIAAFSSPPIKYDEFNSLLVSTLISVAVGVAAGLASTDDVGRRELIGLAATAQVAVIPVWFGVCLVFGFPATASRSEIITHAAAFFLNILTIIIASLLTYVALGAASSKNWRKKANL